MANGTEGSNAFQLLGHIQPKLNAENYLQWSEAVTMGLELFGKEHAVSESSEIGTAEEQKTIRVVLLMSMETEQRDACKGSLTAQEVWKTAKIKYGTPSRLLVAQLKKAFYGGSFSGTNVQEFINKKRELCAKLRNAGHNVTDDLVDTILVGVREHYESLVESLEGSSDLKLQALEQRLLTAQEARQVTHSKQEVASFVIKRCSHCKKKGHVKENCYKLHTCTKCKKIGHHERYCKQHVREQSNLMNCSEFESYNAYSVLSVDEIQDPIIDSGASNHMTGQTRILKNIKSTISGTVQCANGNSEQIKGSGTAIFQSKVPQKVQMLHIPGLENTLYSVGKAVKGRKAMLFTEEGCLLLKTIPKIRSDDVLMDGRYEDGVYRMNCDTSEKSYQASLSRPCMLELWHRRLGHRSYSDLIQMSKNKCVENFSLAGTFQIRKCSDCSKAKARKRSFPKTRADHPRAMPDLIHSDLCGPLPVPSLQGAQYFVTYIEEVSRMKFTFLLKSKNDQEIYFKRVETYCKRQTGRPVKILRADNGGEYTSHNFQHWLQLQGIEFQSTVPSCSSQNGVAERSHLTLMNMARAMLQHSGLPAQFWGAAVLYATYISNMLPHPKETTRTPFEMFYQRKPNASNIKVFGCIGYAMSRERRNKLESRADPLIFIGVSSSQRGWKMYDPEGKKTKVFYHVDFHESTFHSTLSPSTASSTDFHLHLYSAPTEEGSSSSNASTSDDGTTDCSNTTSLEDEDTSSTTENTQHEYSSDHEQSSSVPETQASDSPANNQVSTAENNELPGANSDGDSNEQYYITQRGRRIPQKPLPYWQCNNTTVDITKLRANDIPEPNTVEEALTGAFAKYWRNAMHKEFQSLIKNGTWRKENLPPDRNAIKGKWVFKVKPNTDGTVERFKARLVCKGFTQRYGVDYLETFAPVAKFTSVRMLLSLVVQHKKKVRHFDFETAFLNGKLEEEIFLELPQQCGNMIRTFLPDYHSCPVRLLKSLYGLKQAGRCWNRNLDAYLRTLNFKPAKSDPCIYSKKSADSGTVHIGLFVDDCLVIADTDSQLDHLFADLQKQYSVKDLGKPTQFLGMEVGYKPDGSMFLSQERYINDLLKKFEMQSCNPSTTPYLSGVKLEKKHYTPNGEEEILSNKPYAELVGSINWLATSCRPDLARIASQLCRFVSKPYQTHWKAAVQVLKYLQRTKDNVLMFEASSSNPLLYGYSDSDWAGDATRKSTSGYCFKYGNSLISWRSKLQQSTALSSTEAEYMAVCFAVREAIWLRKLLLELGYANHSPTPIYEDNVGCISLSENWRADQRTKHIEVQYHFTREQVEAKRVKLEAMSTKDMLADGMTKSLAGPRFQWFTNALNMKRFH